MTAVRAPDAGTAAGYSTAQAIGYAPGDLARTSTALVGRAGPYELQRFLPFAGRYLEQAGYRVIGRMVDTQAATGSACQVEGDAFCFAYEEAGAEGLTQREPRRQTVVIDNFLGRGGRGFASFSSAR